MDIDMHYYGTYALARAAGLRADVARRIATAAEFVDDSTDTTVLVHPDGARFRGEATAHHPTDLLPNNDRDNQLMVWVPFHFLPGAVGDSLSRRLRCVKNSGPARQMVAHHLDWSDKPYAVELLGITAHVYADTFAHYGFAGISSRVNRVQSDSFKLVNGDPLGGTVERFFAKYGIQGGLLGRFRAMIAGEVAEGVTGALGHGAVAVFPDQPYLEWSYSYEMADQAGAAAPVERQNANDYVEGAAALHDMFRQFAARRPQLADGTGGLDFDAITATVRAIVTKPAPREERIPAWQGAMQDGKLSRKGSEAIPGYDHTDWRKQIADLATLPKAEMASGVPAYQFSQAAAMHRNYVLRELLPANGIYVI